MKNSETVTANAYARAGLLGNPSDGYNGKTISLIIRNFAATVTMEPDTAICFIPQADETTRFDSIASLHRQISSQGYYGGLRLLRAATKRFYEYCKFTGAGLHNRNFAMSYASDIPRQVGLAGSSAIVTAALRALSLWYDVGIPPHLLASLTLSAETELGIPAGLQDRVIQAHEGVVYMDFSTDKMRTKHGLAFGEYVPIDPALLTNVYVAYASDGGEPTEVLHNDLRKRFNAGDPDVIAAMAEFASLAEQGHQAIQNSDHASLHRLIDRNFDLRSQVCQLHSLHKNMIAIARSTGASAKYCGSGGAIVGTYDDDAMYVKLAESLSRIGCVTIKPMTS